jgi:hypothetical protein
MFGCRIILASCLASVAMLAMPGAAQTPPVGGSAALETEKSALVERMRRDPADLTATLAYTSVAARPDDTRRQSPPRPRSRAAASTRSSPAT